MAIEKMKLIRVYGLVGNLDDFITSCCISGDFHPENAMNYMSDSLGFVPLNEENPYTVSIQKIEEIASIAGVTLKETFNDNEIILDRSEVDYIDELSGKINETFVKRTETAQKLESVESALEQFTHFEGIDIPVEDLFSMQFVSIRFGSIPIDCYPKLKAYENKNKILFFESSRDEKNLWGIYVAPKSCIDDADRIFASLYFERIVIPNATGTSNEIVSDLKKQKNELDRELKTLDKTISKFWSDNSEKCERIYAYLKVADLAFGLRQYAAKDTDSDYITYVGWVPKSSMKWFEERIEKIDNITYEEYEPQEDKRSDPPVKLKNRKLIRPFEMFVEMYGLPSYGGVDITPFVAITYSLLFGIMFADLGQGFILALGGYIVYKLKGAKLAKILVPCGACSMIFGFLFGSVFGYEEMLDPVYHALGMKGKPIEVMNSINTVLLLAIGIGIALVAVSMCLNIYCSIRNKKIGEALFSQNGLTGLILYGVLVCAIIGFMTKKSVIPGALVAVVAVVCFTILYCKELLIDKIDNHGSGKPESMTDFLMQNVFEVIEYVLSYFSNTVSFLRVGAFVLVHAGMMMVFSSLSSDPTSPGGIAIMVVGNIIVIALEGLLTGIQVLRLEFYEMFSRFYSGDGKPFKSVGMRKNRGFIFKIINAFRADSDGSNESVEIKINK